MPMAGLLHVVSLWWALPRITIGKECRTHWPIPWQLDNPCSFYATWVNVAFSVPRALAGGLVCTGKLKDRHRQQLQKLDTLQHSAQLVTQWHTSLV